MSDAHFDFHCSACGKCCNSPPLLSLPELFRHQHRFIGGLALRRVRRLRIGQSLAQGGRLYSIGAEDLRAAAALSAQLLHPAGDTDILLALQGMDHPSRGACPALDADGHCSLYAAGRPATCAVVPLDALLPDRLQHLVLAGRIGEAAYFGADCLSTEARAGHRPLAAGASVLDAGYAAALALRRNDLAADRRHWGDAVWRLIGPELLGEPGVIPVEQALTVAPVPVLLVVAGASDACRQRVLDFIAAQQALIAETIAAALQRRLGDDKPFTRQLRAFADTYRALERRLREAPAPRPRVNAAELEAGLGLAPVAEASLIIPESFS